MKQFPCQFFCRALLNVDLFCMATSAGAVNTNTVKLTVLGLIFTYLHEPQNTSILLSSSSASSTLESNFDPLDVLPHNENLQTDRL